MTEKEKQKPNEDNDEKIKTAILNHLKIIWGNCQDDICGIHVEDAIDWIEKQGKQTSLQTNERAWLYLVSEVLTWKDGIGQYLDDPRVQELAKKLCNKYAQKLYNLSVISNSSNTGKINKKSADKIEPKFKVGDWVVFVKSKSVCQVEKIENCEYTLRHVLGSSLCLSFYNENLIREWTLQDAKDGDILATSAGAFIYNGNDGGGSCPGSYCGINTLGNLQKGTEHHWTGKKVYPATKEQHDILYQKIKERKEKFGTKKLKPFDKVLVRDSCTSTWRCTLYSHTKEDESRWKYVTDNSAYEYCIPYNDETKHLVGTTEEVPEYYRYWED